MKLHRAHIEAALIDAGMEQMDAWRLADECIDNATQQNATPIVVLRRGVKLQRAKAERMENALRRLERREDLEKLGYTW